MSWIVKASSLPGSRKTLTRAGAGPDLSIIRPSGATQGVGPDPDPCEEVALSKSSKVTCCDILDAPRIDFARRDHPGLDQLPEPRSLAPVDLVVVG